MAAMWANIQWWSHGVAMAPFLYSEREEFRQFYPGKTAEEMFLVDDEE